MIAPRDTKVRSEKAAAQKAPPLLSWDQLLSVPHSEIPALVGELEQAKATLLARLVEPESREPEEDFLLTAAQVAEKLQVERNWVYRHKDKLGAMALSRKKLRFPSSGVEAYLRRRKAASSGRRK
jgi:predicted DNA-binding transcriptional regulator AlpA